MSDVYLGFDVASPAFVALKTLRGGFRFDDQLVGRLRREAEIYQKLKHPAIVRLVDTGPTPDGGFYLAQELLRGSSLREILDQQHGPADVPLAMAVLEDVAGALRTAHREGIVHRDVKPQNVIVGPDGRATLFDFGIALADDSHVHTAEGTVMGTLMYAAPEQRRGGKADERSDIFSLGCVFYEFLTGRRAIQAASFDELLEARTSHLPSPSDLVPILPFCLDEITRKLMADDPAQRYQDLRYLLIDLGRLRLEADEETQETLFGTTAQRRLDGAVAALRKGQLDEAKRLSAELGETPPVGLEAKVHQLRGMIHVREGVPRLGVKELERALGYAGGDTDLVLDCALLLLDIGELDEARALLEGCPGPARWNILVLGLLDALNAMRDAPESALAAAGKGGQRGLFGALRALLGRR